MATYIGSDELDENAVGHCMVSDIEMETVCSKYMF